MNIYRRGVIDQQTINSCDLCYRFSKDGPDFSFGKLRIRDSRDEPHFPAKRKSLSCQIQMNTLFKNNDGIKRRKFNRNIRKATRVAAVIY